MSNREDPEQAQALCGLANAVESLAHAICEAGNVLKDEMRWRRSHAQLPTNQDLQEMENRLMTAVQEITQFLEEQQKYNDEDAKRVENLAGDIKLLHEKINGLVATAGLPEDLRKKIADLKAQSQKTGQTLKDLDEANPPAVPDAPPEDPNAPPVETDPNAPSNEASSFGSRT